VRMSILSSSSGFYYSFGDLGSFDLLLSSSDVSNWSKPSSLIFITLVDGSMNLYDHPCGS
jgi:hypothetical protein